MLYDWNESDCAVWPKRDNVEGELTADWAAEETRLPPLTCTEMKATAGAANYQLKATISERIRLAQQGFVAGRNFTKYIVRLDAGAHGASLMPRASHSCSAFESFDLAAAFPSLGRARLFRAPGRLGLPRGYLDLFKATCYSPFSYAKIDGIATSRSPSSLT